MAGNLTEKFLTPDKLPEPKPERPLFVTPKKKGKARKVKEMKPRKKGTTMKALQEQVYFKMMEKAYAKQEVLDGLQ